MGNWLLSLIVVVVLFGSALTFLILIFLKCLKSWKLNRQNKVYARDRHRNKTKPIYLFRNEDEAFHDTVPFNESSNLVDISTQRKRNNKQRFKTFR